MNYDMNLIKYRKSGFFRIAAAILMICFTLFGLTACADTTDSKDNNDDNALIQGTWEIDTGSGAGYKFVDDKFMWLKFIENVNDNYWYGDVEYYNGAEAMDIAGLTEEELKSSLPYADDYYGRHAFQTIYDYLTTHEDDEIGRAHV